SASLDLGDLPGEVRLHEHAAAPRSRIVDDVATQAGVEDMVLRLEVPDFTLVGDGLDLLDHAFGDLQMTSPALVRLDSRVEVDQIVSPALTNLGVEADALARRARDEMTKAEHQDRRLRLEALELVRSVAGAKPIPLVVTLEESQLGLSLRVENAPRHPLVAIRGVDLRTKPVHERLRMTNRQPPDVARALDEIRIDSEVSEEHLGASLERFSILVVDPDLAGGDTALGHEEAQQPRHVLVEPHAGTVRQVHQRDPVADRQISRRPRH